MTAHRVVTEHGELDNCGAVTHAALDGYVTQAPWVIVSGAAGPPPPSARKLVAGPGVTITDNGPGGDLVITATGAVTGSSVSWMEKPSGTVDGVNVEFVLSHEPLPSSSLMFFVGGVLQSQGPADDYVLSGSTVFMSWKPRAGANVYATYPHA
jgi:hypothetical protein